MKEKLRACIPRPRLPSTWRRINNCSVLSSQRRLSFSPSLFGRVFLKTLARPCSLHGAALAGGARGVSSACTEKTSKPIVYIQSRCCRPDQYDCKLSKEIIGSASRTTEGEGARGQGGKNEKSAKNTGPRVAGAGAGRAWVEKTPSSSSSSCCASPRVHAKGRRCCTRVDKGCCGPCVRVRA